MRAVLLLVAVVFSLGSASTSTPRPSTPFVAAEPIRERVPDGITDDDVYAATIRVITDAGGAIKEKDKDAGVVTTEPEIVDKSADGKDAWLHSLRIYIREGELIFDVQCSHVATYGGPYRCGPERSEAYMGVVQRLRDNIIAEAKRIADRRAAQAPTSTP